MNSSGVCVPGMLSTTPHPPPCGVCVPTQAARENPSVHHIWAYTYLHTIGSGQLQHHCQSDASVMLARVDVNTGVDSIKCLRRVSCSISTMWACFFRLPSPLPPMNQVVYLASQSFHYRRAERWQQRMKQAATEQFPDTIGKRIKVGLRPKV